MRSARRTSPLYGFAAEMSTPPAGISSRRGGDLPCGGAESLDRSLPVDAKTSAGSIFSLWERFLHQTNQIKNPERDRSGLGFAVRPRLLSPRDLPFGCARNACVAALFAPATVFTPAPVLPCGGSRLDNRTAGVTGAERRFFGADRHGFPSFRRFCGLHFLKTMMRRSMARPMSVAM